MAILKQSILALAISLFATISGALMWLAYETIKMPPRGGHIILTQSVVEADDKRGYVMRPNLDITFQAAAGTHHYSTGADRLRSEIPEVRQDRADILFVGDSQTFAQSIPFERTFVEQVGRTLDKKVANSGVTGYGLVSMLGQLEAYEYLKPKAIVVGHYYDTLDRAVSPCYPGTTYPCISVPYIEVKDEKVTIVGPQDNNKSMDLERRFRAYTQGNHFNFFADMFWKARSLAGDFYFFRWGRHPVRADDAPIVSNYIYSRFSEVAARLGAKLIVLYIPDYFGEGREVVAPAPYVVDAVARNGGALVDLTAELQQVKTRLGPNGVMIPGDGHLNVEMHDLISGRLAAALSGL